MVNGKKILKKDTKMCKLNIYLIDILYGIKWKIKRLNLKLKIWELQKT